MSNSSSHNNLMRMHSPNGHVAPHILSLKSKLLAQGCSQKFTPYVPFFLLQIKPKLFDRCLQSNVILQVSTAFCRFQAAHLSQKERVSHSKKLHKWKKHKKIQKNVHFV